MKERAVFASQALYIRLVGLYPPGYRCRFERELCQVFTLLCRDAYRQNGNRGVFQLWLLVLWDWGRTAAYQWLIHFSSNKRETMSGAIDRQLGDMIWSISCGLRAGYSVRQVMEQLADEAPEPAASAARVFLAELEKGAGYADALQAWKQAEPSIARLVTVMDSHRQTGGSLPDLLDPLSDELVQAYGSDPVFYEPMRRQAEALRARLPERAARLSE